MECRKTFEGTGEIGLPDAWWQVLVVSEEEKIRTEGTDGSEKISVSPKENTRMGKGFLEVFAARVFRFLRQRTLHALDGGIPRHKYEEFAASRGFPQEKHVPRVETVEGAANEDALHFFWRSMTYTLFSSRR